MGVTTCYVRTSLIRRYIGLHRFFSLFPNTEARVRYDLASGLHTIRSCVLFRYDINLRATYTTILSSGGAQIPIDLVSSATDSFW